MPQKNTVKLLLNALNLSDPERAQFLSMARGISLTISPPAVLHGLPVFLTPMIGRDAIQSEVTALLRQKSARLLTLIEPAGIGKTRLSAHIASSLQDNFSDGIFFVPLATIWQAENVLSSIAHVLGIRETGEQSLLQLIINALRAKKLLLILDNFEQVTTAAPLLIALLHECLSVSMLVTSRAILHLRDEYVVVVPPLEIPDTLELLTIQQAEIYSAVSLFLQRMRIAGANIEVPVPPSLLTTIVTAF